MGQMRCWGIGDDSLLILWGTRRTSWPFDVVCLPSVCFACRAGEDRRMRLDKWKPWSVGVHTVAFPYAQGKRTLRCVRLATCYQVSRTRSAVAV